MNFAEELRALNEFDLSDLDMENIGSWPMALKVIVLALLYVAILVLRSFFLFEGAIAFWSILICIMKDWHSFKVRSVSYMLLML